MSRYTDAMVYDATMHNDYDFNRWVEKRLKENLTEVIFAKLNEGEKIISVSDVQSTRRDDYHTIESRIYININDLVRCKDCRHRYKNMTEDEQNIYDLYGVGGDYCSIYGTDAPTDDDFCSRGEKKDDD